MIPHCGSDLLFPNDTEHLFIYLLAIYMAFLKYVSSDPLCTRSLQLSATLYDPMDCGPPGSSVHGDSAGKNTGVGCHFLLQGSFLTQGLGLLSLSCIGRQALDH